MKQGEFSLWLPASLSDVIYDIGVAFQHSFWSWVTLCVPCEMQGWSQIRCTLSCWTLVSLVIIEMEKLFKYLLSSPCLYLVSCILLIDSVWEHPLAFIYLGLSLKGTKYFDTQWSLPPLCSLQRQSHHMLYWLFGHVSSSDIITQHDNALIALTRLHWVAAVIPAAVQSTGGDSSREAVCSLFTS